MEIPRRSLRTGVALLAGAAAELALAPALVLALVSAAGRADGATVEFERISLAQGLSQSTIEAIWQDRTGFLWFVTEDGLNRYDGYRFRVYRHEAGNPNSLSHNELKAVTQDSRGMLWIGAFEGGLTRLDPATGVFTRYRNDPANPASLGGNTVRCLLEDAAGNLWIGLQGGGLDRFDRRTGKFVHHRHDPRSGDTLPNDDVRALAEDGAGGLWVGTWGGGLARLDPATGRFTPAPSLGAGGEGGAGGAADGHAQVSALLREKGGLWVGTYGGGLDLLDPGTGAVRHHHAERGAPGALQSNLVKALAMDHEGTPWVATDGGGLSRFDRGTRAFATYRFNAADARSLSSDRALSLLADRSHVLWVGTYGGGLSKLDVGRKKFTLHRGEPGNPHSLGSDLVWSIHEDADGILWIGTDAGGLDRYDRRAGTWRHFRHDPRDPSSLAHDAVRVVMEDRRGDLWLGTNGGGLDRFEKKTGKFTHFRHDARNPSSIARDELRAVYEDRAGTLWVGTFGGGLDRFDRETGTFTHFRNDPADPSSLSNDFVRTIHEDRAGRLWVGTQGGGLNRLDRTQGATGKFTRYRTDPRDPGSLGNDYAFALHEDTGGVLWVGTYGGGLNRLDPGAGKFTRFTEADGLASDSVYGILEDEAGRLWVSTNNGLSCFDPKARSFRNYDVRDGLQSNEFNGGAYSRSARGEMFFGGIAGFNSFFPSEIGVNTEVPTVVVTDLQLFNRSVRVGEGPASADGARLLPRPIEYTDEVELSWRDDVVTFEFAALHFASPEKNRYSFLLEGFSREWIPARADRRSATFTGLNPGHYVFRVKAANPDGVWNEAGAAVRLVVRPPFWATWWFRLGAAAAAAGLTVLALRRRVRTVRLSAEMKAAHDAQMAIMPQEDPVLPGFEVSGTCLPASEVGGDFFDTFRPRGGEGTLTIAVGDVSGKGMRSAMTAVLSSGMVEARLGVGESLEEVATSLNRLLHRKVEHHMFTALCLASLEPGTRDLTLVNAGLCEPLLKSAGGTAYLESPEPRLPLGAREGTEYRSRTVSLGRGDVVVLFTDGVPEAVDAKGEPWGYEALAAFLRRLDVSALPARGICEAVVREAERHSGGSKRRDDMTVVALKVL